MSILDMFKSAPAPAPEPAPTPATETTVETPLKTPDLIGGDPSALSSPEVFKDLWDNSSNPEDLAAAAASTDPTAGILIDPAKINETVSGIDFTAGLPANIGETISAGGPEAQTAFLEALNTVSRQVFSQSMIANSTLTKQAIDNSATAFDNRAAASLKQSQITQAGAEANSALTHPSFSPIVKAVETQLAAKYPAATAAQISETAQKYLGEFATQIKGEPEAAIAAPGSSDPDWEKLFGV